MRSSSASPVSSWPRRLTILLVIAATLPYLPTLRHDFVFDDTSAVVENAHIQKWGAIGEALSVWRGEPLNYRPLRYVSLAIDWNLGGGRPWLFHLTNILLHVACSLLLLHVLRRLGLSRSVTWGATFLFALHPVHAGTVAYVSARKDLLVTAFFLLTVALFLSYRAHGGAARMILVFTAAACAAFSKETAVTLPVILLLADAWLTPAQPNETTRQTLVRAVKVRAAFYAGWALLAGAYVYYKLVVWPATKVARELWFDTWTHLGTAFGVWARALGTMLLPFRTIPDYQGMHQVGQGWNLLSFIGVLATTALLLVAWRLRRALPAVTLGIGFVLITWIPTSGVLPIAEVFAEHYLYLPSVGLCLAWAGLVHGLARRVGAGALATSSPLRIGAVVGGLILLGWTLILQGAWATPQRVWETSIRHNPRSPRAHSALALLYQEQGRAGEARRLARQAARMAPLFDTVQANYAGILYEQRDLDGAIEAASASLVNLPNSPRLELVRAKALLAKGDIEGAISAYERVAALSPTPEHLGLLGETLSLASRWEEAREVLQRALSARPDYSEALTNLGLVSFSLGDTVAAERHLREAARLSPDDPDPHNNLAVLLYYTGRLQEARREAEASIRLGRSLHPDFARALEDSVAKDAEPEP